MTNSFSAIGTVRKDQGEHEGWGIGNSDVDPGQRQVSGSYAGSYVTFKTTAGEQVLMKIAHGTSYEQAEQRLRDEVPGWDFDRVTAAARGEWANLLNSEIGRATGRERGGQKG